MVEVIKESPTSEIVCKQCKTRLSYKKSEVKDMRSIGLMSAKLLYQYIVCPICDYRIVVYVPSVRLTGLLSRNHKK
jgi:DNA-directed RNA polymerase subunit RPC12/RpoP